MANLFYGVGDTYAKTKTLSQNTAAGAIGQDVIIPLYLFDFEYTENSKSLEAKGQIKGIKKTLASAQGEVDSALKLSTQLVNWSQLGFFLNQFSGTATNVSIPILKTGVIPSSAPYEVVDAAITANNAAGVYVYVSDDIDPGYRKLTTASSVPAGSAKVSGTDGKITFNVADAGKYFTYTVPITKATAETYGGKGGVDKYGTIEFYGVIYGTEDYIHFPSLNFKSSPSMKLTGDIATLEVEFSANVNVGSGDEYPYVITRR